MFAKSVFRPMGIMIAAATTALVVGCAQTPVSSDAARGTTLGDAQEQARGKRSSQPTSSQIAIGFGAGKDAAVSPLEASQLRELLEPRTFLGTVACPNSDTACSPVRFLVTFSPNGMWRARMTAANQDLAPVVSQGCWHQTGTAPSRIMLQTETDTVLADLSFVYDQQLRVNVFNYVKPTLDTHLSRQPEIDSINELANQTGPLCRN